MIRKPIITKEEQELIKKTYEENKAIRIPLGLKDSELPEIKTGTVRTKESIKLKKGKLSFWDRRKLKTSGESAFFINMLFSNGTCKEFVISTKEEIFQYKKRHYYLKYEDSWFNLTQNQYQLFFFDDFPVPLDRQISKQGLKAFWSVNPSNLKPLIDMQYVKILSQNLNLDKYLKLSAIMGIVNFFQLAILLLLLLFGGG